MGKGSFFIIDVLLFLPILFPMRYPSPLINVKEGNKILVEQNILPELR